MVYTKENIFDGIEAKLNRIADDRPMLEPFCNAYRNVIMNYPIEIEQNVIEWINDVPLTEVNCHGISVKEVMDDYELPDHYFLVVVRNFSAFKANGFVGTAVCCWDL